ncbi:MAG: hypothetical protein IRZ26_03210 [Clostridia bacterium]|nr:hypothetical protein [Clostridia bacterium]MCL6522877.1 hypothetical protein [Bacillota bacterium]
MNPVELHPMLVHFPIALFLTMLLVEVLWRIRRESWLERASALLLDLSAISSVLTVAAGFLAAVAGGVPLSSLLAGEEAGGVAGAVAEHMQRGLFAMVLLVGLAFYRHRVRRAGRSWEGWLAWAGLALAFLMVLTAGLSGGELVYRLGFGR